ncbi:MAG: hypothetical protein HY689_00310 [Chloroflexi bacterium]|nr:hypothetical protein [Chloroflexota bacterium]
MRRRFVQERQVGTVGWEYCHPFLPRTCSRCHTAIAPGSWYWTVRLSAVLMDGDYHDECYEAMRREHGRGAS